MRVSTTILLAAPAALLVAACVPEEVPQVEVFRPVYLGVDTALLEGDLVRFRVDMRGARDGQDVQEYADCAAAQYALIRGFGFARHVRTNLSEEGGIQRGDAVYTVSPAIPGGIRTIDAEVTLAECRMQGIPTV